VGKVPQPNQEIDLKLFPPPESMADCFPAKPVRPGYSWEVDAGKLARLLGSGVQLDSGKWKMKFEKTIRLQGEACAQIADAIELCGKMRGEKDGLVHIELKAQGTTQFSLQHTFGHRAWKGTLTLSGTVTEGGQRAETTITGPVTITMKRKRT
jgi:hypothetical protein